MARVETLLAELGIVVPDYSHSTPPVAELVPQDHPYLQGNDGGYVDGRIYVNAETTADCTGLTLVHELVHDATIKHRLFSNVPNSRLRDAFEALADSITEAAAQEPYLPGCLPKRRFDLDRREIAALAVPQRTAAANERGEGQLVSVAFQAAPAR